VGTATVSVQELRAALRETKQSQYGILSQDELTLAVHEARASGETVVMTNGCFDILHAGHVRYLEQARKLGDRLVVAVNDDASVAKLKGRDRPINPLEDRMAVLVALGSVDWVVPFSEDTPERLICAVQPNILVKGGDYKAHEVAGGECVKSNGGRVEILPLVENRSTTRIIDAIRGGGAGGSKSR
jgi:D-beta-D-heptose 7-phosphate kinase/D-beta-D-heptose 1-phosphate adenosyltransferase